ncbi:hypothetical protein Tco_1242736, partial [Tanacetum coccineum]
CGFSLSNGTCINCTYGDGKPVTCCECESPLNGGFCLFCNSRAGNSSAYDPNPNSHNDSLNFSDYTPHPQYQPILCEFCGNDARYGHYCTPQVPIISNPEPCYNQNYDEFPQTLPRETPKVLMQAWTNFLKLNIGRQSLMNCPAFYYDDDDDEEYTIAITPVLLTVEPDNSLSMGERHLSTILERKILVVEDLLSQSNSGSPTSYSDLSLPDYEAFFCDSEPDSGNFTMDVVEDIFDNPTREPYVSVPRIVLTADGPSHPSSGFRFHSFPLFNILLPFLSKNEDKVFNLGILASNEETSPHLLSYRDFNPSKIISELWHKSRRRVEEREGGGTSLSWIFPFLHFYPP